MSVAQGTRKQIRFGRQSAKGTIALVNAGKIIRRTSAAFMLKKEEYTTEEEITTTRQLNSNRHGSRMVEGSLSGILSAGTYADQLSAILMRDFLAVSAMIGMSITIDPGPVVGGVQTYTVTRAAGDFLTGGVKKGSVVRLTSGAFDPANLNKNLLVISSEALELSVIPMNGEALVAEGPIASAAMSLPGKVTYAAPTNQTAIYYTVESWYPDVPTSERNTDVRITQADVKLPGSGNAMIDFSAIGLNQVSDPDEYFTTPAAETTTEALTASGGLLLVAGIPQAIITDLSFSLNGNGNAADPVVGTNLRPDVFMGKLVVKGSFTAYFDSQTLADAFRNETQVELLVSATDGQAGDADFVSFSMPAVKIGTADEEDAETGLKRTYSFTATYYAAGGAAVEHQQSTIMVQDSAAA